MQARVKIEKVILLYTALTLDFEEWSLIECAHNPLTKHNIIALAFPTKSFNSGAIPAIKIVMTKQIIVVNSNNFPSFIGINRKKRKEKQ